MLASLLSLAVDINASLVGNVTRPAKEEERGGEGHLGDKAVYQWYYTNYRVVIVCHTPRTDLFSSISPIES